MSAEPGDPALAQRKLRDAAILLPVVGALMLLPPIARIFALDLTAFGVPVTALYLFGSWFLLILAARAVGHRLLAHEAADAARARAEHDSRDPAA